MISHPGKKLLFMGQDFAQEQRVSEARGLDWELLEEEKHHKFWQFMKDAVHLYKSQPALYEQDLIRKDLSGSMPWNGEKNILSFLRTDKKGEHQLLIVCNFSALPYEEYRVGRAKSGKYKEIFNSDAKTYGGSGMVNPRVKSSGRWNATIGSTPSKSSWLP